MFDFRAGIAAVLIIVLGAGVSVAEPRHGLSIFGDLKYSAEFQHFDYVNPDAPKAGTASQIGTAGRTTFDSFNNYIVRGDAAQGLELLFDSLMVRAFDEPDAVYGLVAKTAEVADDGLSVTFNLRKEAQFADGTPVTADDIIYSFETLKKHGDPRISNPLRDVVSAEAIDDQTVRYRFQGSLIRDLPITVAQLPILSKAFYETVDFTKTSLEPPLGSGPYRIGAFKPGTYVSYERRKDYWAKDLPVNRGRHNFDVVRFEYYRDRTLELENLLSGNFDFREEFTSKDWATGYDSKTPVRDGRVVKETLPDGRPSGAQGFFINLRRDKFKDVRVRKALDLAFDFEWSNRNLFYGLYQRTESFFENSDMKASGSPSGEELALLEPFRDRLPAAVFGDVYVPAKTNGSGNNRNNLREAARLLSEAGWKQTSKGLRNAKGQPFDLEILYFSPSFERILGPYSRNLRRIGINANLRIVDASQYQQRLKEFDFDITTQRYSLRLTPGVELKTFWGSNAANQVGSYNLSGISDPVLDALIDKIVSAPSRNDLVVAARAADRVLRAQHYWVPQWYKASHNIAYWNKFGRPATKPKYARGALDTWWFDAEKAEGLKR